MKKILTLSVAFIAIFVFLGLMPVHGEAEIYDRVIRLHVLANSDSEEDQSLKLSVRDVVLKEASKIGADVSNIDEAKKMIEESIPDMEKAAEKYIKEVGYDYDVKIEFDREIYATKNYGEFCFPAGKYLSLQVKRKSLA